MEKYSVVIAGSGTTSRANLEALLEDHFYAKGAEGTVYIIEEGKLSQGKVFAEQYSKDKNKPVIYIKLLKESLSRLDQKNTSCFIFWSDEDKECQAALALATELGIPCYDLTEGLLPLTAVEGIKQIVEPVIPVKEEITPQIAETPYVEPEDEDVDEDEEDDDEEEYDEDEAGNLYFGIEAIAKIFARAIVEEIEKAKKGPVA